MDLENPLPKPVVPSMPDEGDWYQLLKWIGLQIERLADAQVATAEALRGPRTGSERPDPI